jgi:hypothetical protein
MARDQLVVAAHRRQAPLLVGAAAAGPLDDAGVVGGRGVVDIGELAAVPRSDAVIGVQIDRGVRRGCLETSCRDQQEQDREDRHPMYRGSASQALAANRNGLIDLWRHQGWTYIADAVHACAASLRDTLLLISALQGL